VTTFVIDADRPSSTAAPPFPGFQPNGASAERVALGHPCAPPPAPEQAAVALLLVLSRYAASPAVPLALHGRTTRFTIDPDATAAGLLSSMVQALQQVRVPDPAFPPRDQGPQRGHVGFSVRDGDGPAASCPDGAACLYLQGEVLQLVVDPAWIPEPLAQAIVRQLGIALAWVRDHPHTPVSTLDIVAGEDRTRVTAWFNDTDRVNGSEEATLHGLVLEQAARHPDATAVIAGEIRLSYAELVDRAGHLAAILHTHYRVRPGSRVGIMAGRTESLIIALLGILRAGAVYVPINPGHPPELVDYMLTNAGAEVLLVDAESVAGAGLFGGQLAVLEVELHDDGTRLAAPPVATASDDLAYVIYTSGSTGRPKGSAVSHGAIVNTICWRRRYYEFSGRDVVLQVPSFAFDSSVADIFTALASGATLVMIPEERRLDARFVRELCDRHHVTTAILTPGYYRLLLESLSGATSLRILTVAGESVSPALVDAHARMLAHVTLVNEYGPTEAAVCTTATPLTSPVSSVSIGTPIDNMQVHILDATGRLCGIGMPGELWLTGRGLADGYVNQPERTAERFRQHRIDGTVRRFYLTGDRGCWRADGLLEFFGRVDRQVKIRGFRVELDEIDVALGAIPGARHGAVVARPDAAGELELIAFVEGDALSPASVREHLARVLPHYMVPGVVRVLRALPLTPNGKVDRAELLAIEEHADLAHGDQECRSPFEQQLRQLMEEVLQRPALRVTDNFFDVGGNSLRAMELTTRLWKDLRVVLQIGDLYEWPTVRQLATFLEGTLPSP
jgi:amino acid adenylation domain-containing protein